MREMTADAEDRFSFGSRLQDAFARCGHLCVGIDPHPGLLDAWGLSLNAAGARDFGLAVVAAAAGSVGIVKPQVAFFECFGSAGYTALEDVMAEARAAGLLVIADVKRGDIGSTMDGYAKAWLEPGSSLEVDAITVSPYLGVASLTGTFDRAREHGKGVFVLAATSNSEAKALQQSVAGPGERTVAQSVVDDVTRWNREHGVVNGDDLASVGVVIGATVSFPDLGIATDTIGRSSIPLLVPGFGYQGALVEWWKNILGAAASHAVVAVSRSVLSAGPSGLTDVMSLNAAIVRE